MLSTKERRLTLNTSDIIQLTGILVSLATGIIAIIISVKSLKQNSKMIEGSTRPYISIYGASTYIGSSNYYIVLKNFGQSSATIHEFLYDFDLSKCTVNTSPNEPFQFIDNSIIVPGQSFHALINLKKTLKQTKVINFHISYSSGVHKYEDDFCLNLAGNLGNSVNHIVTEGKELATISETLQDMYIHSL